MNAAVPSVAAAAGRALIDLILPPRCLSCGIPVTEPGTLCGTCWPALTFIGAPFCDLCGVPFVFEVPGDTVCADCLRRPPRYDRARSVLRYDDASRNLLLAFKHGDRTDSAPLFARWLANAAGDLLEDGPLLVPVPLHPSRLFARRYNQSALLCAGLARIAGLDWSADGLARRRRTRSQGRLSPAERRRNVGGAFAATEAGRATVSGRRVVLVDDVLTTGATAEACATALRRGGADGIDVLTLARVTALNGAGSG
ncbi:MAG: ComF family protein [Defluviicoccus sp.]|nr:ComF family protein [Defluviicoccus sp.]MDE0274498.1 ComF family protein [Defluviicoccus sp.]